MSSVRIISAIVDVRNLTLYKEDGETIIIPQGDPRVRGIIEQVLPVIENGGIATVDLSDSNVYQEFEEKTGGMVRFLRVAKKALKSLFGGDDDAVAPTGVFGPVPVPSKAQAVNEILAHAKPVDQDDDESSIVAVVKTDAGEQKIIPDVHQLKAHITHSNIYGSTKGIENLLKRLGAIIDQRHHSVEDVLRFLEKADLPIADDGSIIAYKVLNQLGRDENLFVDCHTGLVKQQVGSYVCVDESLVDKNRRNECSNGLHIARRAYIRSFGGDVCTITKIAPEDIITVPHNDPNKVRVCGYHIIFKLDGQSHQKLRENKPITDTDYGKKLLARAMSGDHVGRLEEVRITGQRGQGVVIAPLVLRTPDENQREDIPVPTQAVAVNVEEAENQAPPVDPKEINKELSEIREEKAVKFNRKETAAVMVAMVMSTESNFKARKEAAKGLVGMKKTAKVPWSRLGVSEQAVKIIFEVLKDEPAPVKTSKKTKAISAKMNGKIPEAPKEDTKPKPTKQQQIILDEVKAGVLTKAAIGRKYGTTRSSINRLINKFGV
jgi:hypothetical protein